MKKMIKVTSRGIVLTSRGKCRTPLLYPILEDTGVIFQMITAQRATVVEILDDGTEVTLTPQNFDKVNSGKVEEKTTSMSKPDPMKTTQIKPKKQKTENEEKKQVEEPQKEPEVPVVDESSKAEQEPPINTKTMSRKERKKLEYLQKQKEQEAAKAAEEKEESSVDTTIPEDAIEE